MLTTPIYLLLIITTASILLLILMLFLSLRRLKKQTTLLEKSLASNQMLLTELQTLFVQLEDATQNNVTAQNAHNTEIEQVTKHLEHRIKNLQVNTTQLQQTQLQQPEDKLYSRALKMVELGADAQELVTECDIPRAEADILISIHQKKSTT